MGNTSWRPDVEALGAVDYCTRYASEKWVVRCRTGYSRERWGRQCSCSAGRWHSTL